ncbi:MAG: four helix bundle protein [Ignavibacteria bacterium]|nr:four helix bundle protein [Ignavibacteria bacterium]
MKTNLIIDKTYDFSLKIILLYKELKKVNEFTIGKQLLRSGTGIGANVQESIAAQSRKDFINKMAIASKEARETKYWIHLIRDSNFITYDFSILLRDLDEIIKIPTSIVKTSSEKL